MLLSFDDLDTAQREVRRLLAAGQGQDLEVRLSAKTYMRTTPLVFTELDSGRNGYTVTWTAEPGGRVELSGGVVVTGWRPAEHGRWVATVPDAVLTPRQLYVNGLRASWARSDWLEHEDCKIGPEGMTGAGALGVAAYGRPSDVELVFRVRWRDYHCRITDISDDLIRFAEPCWTNALPGTGRVGPHWDNTAVGTEIHSWSMFASNALESLTEPGHFVWNSDARTVTYLPRDGEDMESAEVIVPVAEQLVVVDGAHDLVLKGLSFAHTAWHRSDGYVGAQAGFTLTGASGPLGEAGSHYTKPVAALTVRGGRRVTVSGCEFVRLGGAGAVFEAGTKDSTVTASTFADVSSGGLYVGGIDPHPTAEAADEGNTVSFNTFHGTGAEYTDSVAIWAGYTRNLTIERNTLEHLPYSGISIGWGWNQPEAQDPWLGGNRIAGNRITDVLRVAERQYDGGAIYTQGPQPGTVIEANYINRSEYGTTANDGNGIYLDEQSSHILVTGNVVTRVGYKWVSNWAEYGVENRAAGNWTDNTITPAFSGAGSVMEDNAEGLSELPPEAVRVAEQAGAGPWPGPVEALGNHGP
ncbi:right-handed parallel beta-helix repeat-containing protein [Catenulispora sp. NL8]|uniref:Right-handed parallel beta-helix repeat-containing protein n=2 Tax=Catenulispora pinistramenti TaxID=2705254 RepID=A0ABS5KWC8_9ACTN|nr:right-handed parallel beta-helix repeat-containing protein [Catenulispora pinistramenti]